MNKDAFVETLKEKLGIDRGPSKEERELSRAFENIHRLSDHINAKFKQAAQRIKELEERVKELERD